MWWLISVPVVVFFVWASASIRSGVWVRAQCRVKCGGRVVALSFDDGPDPVHTPAVLDILRERGLRAAFFVVGERAAACPEIVERMRREGHLVGNHTWGHRWWSTLWRVEGELRRCDDILGGVRYFRPPFGVTNPPVARAVARMGYVVVGWSVRSLDSVASRPRHRVAEKVFRLLHPGAIVLLHDDRAGSGELLRMILDGLDARGYTVERVDEMLGRRA